MTTLLQPSPLTTEIVIAGAGIIGLTLALELNARGHMVAVIDPRPAMHGASTAAAGMLAANDPHNPAKLFDFAQYSLALYPEYLQRIATLSGEQVAYQSDTVLQYSADGMHTRIAEHSLDPRQLAASLLLAATSLYPALTLIQQTGPYDFVEASEGVEVLFESGTVIHCECFVHAQGAWALKNLPITPRKGQMLRVQLPPSLPGLREVYRRRDVYIVPRTVGPQAGTALIGATVEDVGFDTSTNSVDLEDLRRRASELLPALADQAAAPTLESWAGLRPGTPDDLPLLGALSPRQFAATGHFRNGVLLAPATACAIADLIESRAPQSDLTSFRPDRFRTS